MTGEWATKPISIYGRNSISGTYEFFKKTVLYGGDYKADVKQRPGSAEVVQSVANDKIRYRLFRPRLQDGRRPHCPVGCILWRKMLRYDR